MHRTRPRHPQASYASLIAFGAAINFLILIVLMTCSYLREEPLFWTNEGDWTSRARELVQNAYYPLLALEFLLLAASTAASVYLMSARRASASLAVILLPMLWGLYLMVVANSVANNLDNLWNGRPLHWHPDATWSHL